MQQISQMNAGNLKYDGVHYDLTIVMNNNHQREKIRARYSINFQAHLMLLQNLFVCRKFQSSNYLASSSNNSIRPFSDHFIKLIMIFRKSLISPFLTHRLKCTIISHKFYFGQGGELQFDLTKRNYNISIETIWEDYSSLEIQGLTGASNFTLYEQEGISYFRDEELQSNLKENIEVKLKIPEDYTIRGNINGNITHGSGPVGKKMRSKPFALELLGDNTEMTLGDLKSEQVSLINKEGTITAPNLTVQAGSIQSKRFKSQKLMTSGSISVNCLSMITRSIIMFGKSNGTFTSRDIEIESISGASHINSDGSLKIQRYYGGTNDINIKCKGIKDKVGIQSGTGKVQFPSEEDARQGEKKVVLGRMHKGKLERQGNVILIC